MLSIATSPHRWNGSDVTVGKGLEIAYTLTGAKHNARGNIHTSKMVSAALVGLLRWSSSTAFAVTGLATFVRRPAQVRDRQ